ncbi:MAG: response regulator [PVC group bacterium]|nr:response regulator [PVC group bacterium]
MSEKKLILIVDDDVVTASLAKAFLEEKGYRVTHVQDGEVALVLLEDVVPDLIIMDIVMPKIDGFTTAKRIKYNDKVKHVPIIILSAKEGMKELFAMEGLQDYLVKPVDKEQLLTLVHKHLGK